MPNYSYRAIDVNGKLVRGSMIAFSEGDIEQRLRQNGLTLIKSKISSDGQLSRLLTGGKVKHRILVELYHRLSQTLDLGLPIVTALEENAKLLPSKPLKKILNEIRISIESGNSLYESMSRFPKIFEKLDLGITRMGEQTGIIPQCFKDLAVFHEWKENIKSTLKRATIYPSFIIFAIIAVIGVWVGYVLPQMAVMLTEMGIDLPGMTQAVLGASLFIKANWPILIGGLIVSIAFLFLVRKTKKGEILFDKYLLKIPLFGRIAMNIALARLSRNFSTMHGAGMTINNIFGILTDNVIGNRYLENRLEKAYQEIQLGQSVAGGFEKAGGFPALLLGGIRNGESTGTLDDAFKRLGDYFDGEVKRTVQAMVNAVEPITIVLLGGVFGLIILSILLPLYDVIGQFGEAY
jgi:type IV pilus assembly protein PilC